MVSKIQQRGNSQGVRLARNILNLAHIAVGDEVEIIVEDRQILVKKVTAAKFNVELTAPPSHQTLRLRLNLCEPGTSP